MALEKYHPKRTPNPRTGGIFINKEVKIKIGCQVMCVINIRTTTGDILICNGSQGIVKGFCDVTGYPRVKYNNGSYERCQNELIMFGNHRTW